jgi:muramoyltetrapeptide carboxypeptidase LdcA involved in peptidoglycan recycling
MDTIIQEQKRKNSRFKLGFKQSEISAIWASRGGYGCQHLLRHLKLSKFRKIRNGILVILIIQ